MSEGNSESPLPEGSTEVDEVLVSGSKTILGWIGRALGTIAVLILAAVAIHLIFLNDPEPLRSASELERKADTFDHKLNGVDGNEGYLDRLGHQADVLAATTAELSHALLSGNESEVHALMSHGTDDQSFATETGDYLRLISTVDGLVADAARDFEHGELDKFASYRQTLADVANDNLRCLRDLAADFHLPSTGRPEDVRCNARAGRKDKNFYYALATRLKIIDRCTTTVRKFLSRYSERISDDAHRNTALADTLSLPPVVKKFMTDVGASAPEKAQVYSSPELRQDCVDLRDASLYRLGSPKVRALYPSKYVAPDARGELSTPPPPIVSETAAPVVASTVLKPAPTTPVTDKVAQRQFFNWLFGRNKPQTPPQPQSTPEPKSDSDDQ